MNLLDKIKEVRPNLKENSIKAYIITIQKLNGNKEIKDLDFLADKEEVKKKIRKITINNTTELFNSCSRCTTGIQC